MCTETETGRPVRQATVVAEAGAAHTVAGVGATDASTRIAAVATQKPTSRSTVSTMTTAATITTIKRPHRRSRGYPRCSRGRGALEFAVE